MKKQIPKKNQKNMKNEPKMEPKGLPEFPGKSRKSAPRRPGTTEERPGTPKRPPRHPTAAKMTSKDPKKSPKAPPNDPKRTPSDALGIQKASKRHPKKHQKDTPKEPKLKMENRCKSHRDSDSTNATLKQHCVDNDLSPAECAERLNPPPPRRGWSVLDSTQILFGSLEPNTVPAHSAREKCPTPLGRFLASEMGPKI